MILHHFTCRDGADGIDAAGEIRPNPIPERIPTGIVHLSTGMGDAPPIVWLTDLPNPRRDQVGLTSDGLPCDRMEVRYTVDVDSAERWRSFARRHCADSRWRRTIERYSDPYHWFVHEGAIPRGRIVDCVTLVGAARHVQTVDAAAGVFEGGPESTGWLRQQREADDE